MLDATTGSLFKKTASPFLPETTAPGTNTKLDSDKAKIIAAHYIPSEIVVQAAINTQFLSADENFPYPDSWVIYFTVNVPPSQIRWHEDKYTHLDHLPAGDNYFQLAIEVDANTGDLIQKAAFAPLATIPTYVPFIPISTP